MSDMNIAPLNGISEGQKYLSMLQSLAQTIVRVGDKIPSVGEDIQVTFDMMVEDILLSSLDAKGAEPEMVKGVVEGAMHKQRIQPEEVQRDLGVIFGEGADAMIDELYLGLYALIQGNKG
jgi:hypothetical protein